jgi:hypothetical protein
LRFFCRFSGCGFRAAGTFFQAARLLYSLTEMIAISRFMQTFSLGVWIGAILFFGAVLAPAAFTLFSGDQAGSLVNLTLSRLHLAGMLCGVIYLIFAALAGRSPVALLRPAPLLVLAMIAVTFLSQFWVMGNMEALRAQAGGPIQSLPDGNTIRASFDRLHQLSVRLEGGVLLAGIVALFLTSRPPAQ